MTVGAAGTAGDRYRHVIPDGHVDELSCWCGPEVHPVAGLMHTLIAEDSTSAVLLPVEPGLVGLAWHDVVCPEGPDCRDRPLHAASSPLASMGILDRFLTRLGELR